MSISDTGKLRLREVTWLIQVLVAQKGKSQEMTPKVSPESVKPLLNGHLGKTASREQVCLFFPASQTENPLEGRARRASRLGRGCGKEWRGGRKVERLVADKGVDQTNKHFRDNGRQLSLTMRKGITNMEREKTRMNPEMLDQN